MIHKIERVIKKRASESYSYSARGTYYLVPLVN